MTSLFENQIPRCLYQINFFTLAYAMNVNSTARKVVKIYFNSPFFLHSIQMPFIHKICGRFFNLTEYREIVVQTPLLIMHGGL